ncbi:MAG: nSTAND1 domain-containing NTPase, partial [Methylobacter sp.]
DQLPLLQHLLMRLWDGAEHDDNPVTISLADYRHEKIQSLKNALSIHADEAYDDLDDAQKIIAQQIFCRLTGAESGKADTRNPTPIRELTALTGLDLEQIAAVLQVFLQSGRSFLTASTSAGKARIPNAPGHAELMPDTVIDITHESLIRNWARLEQWTQEEAESAAIYRRLEQTALLHEQGKSDFYRSPELENVLAWQEKKQPTENWAKRYGSHFDLAMTFLQNSVQAQQAEREEEQRVRQREIEQQKLKLRLTSGGLLLALALTAVAFYEGYHAQQTEQQRVVELFQSRLTHASLLAKGEDYAGAKQVLAETDALDNQVSPSLRHARNLLHSFTQIKGGEAEQVYQGAGYPLSTVAISPDGRLLAAGGEHGTLVVFDAHSGKLLQRLSGHATEGTAQDNSVRNIAFTPSGQHLISAGADKKIIIWQRQPSGINAAASSSTAGVQAPPAGPDQSESFKPGEFSYPVASLSDITVFTKQQELNAPDKVNAIGISPDGKLLASGGDDKAVTLWELSSGNKLKTLAGHSDGTSPKSLAFSPDGRYLAGGSFDNTAIIWRLATGKAEHVLRGHTAQVNNLRFYADSTTLATGSSDKTLRLWDVATGKMQTVFNGHTNDVWPVSWLGDYLLSGSDDRSIRLWDSHSGVSLRVLQGHESGVTAFALYGGEAWSASNDGTVRRWAITLPFQQNFTLPSEPASALITPSLSHVAVGFADGALALYDRQTPEPVWQNLAAHNKRIIRLAVNHDGSLLASGSFDKTAKLWQVQATATDLTLLESQTFSSHKDIIHALAFSPDGQTLATAGFDGQIGLFTIDQSKPDNFITSAHEGVVTSVEFDPNSKQLVSSGNKDRKLKLWDLKTNTPVGKNFHLAKDKLLWATISPDGQKLASTGRELAVNVFDRLSAQLLCHLTGHEDAVYRAVFAPDNGQLATVSRDSTVKLWNLDQGKELFSLALPTQFKQPSPVWDFDFRCLKDQCLIAVPLVRGTLQLYRLGYGQPLTEDSTEQKRQQIEIWRQYLDTVEKQLRTNALQPAGQTLREAVQIAQRFNERFPDAPEFSGLKTLGDCQQQQLQRLLKPDSPELNPTCEISLNHATTAKQLNRLGISFYKQKQYPKAQALFAEALKKFPEDLSLLSDDAELALVQGDKPRMQQRLNTLQTLYSQEDGVYSDQYPALMSFLLYLSGTEQTFEAVLKLIEQTGKTVSYDWDFSDIQPVLNRQTPKRQKTAALFIDFFKKRIDLDTLKAKLSAR